MTKLNTYKSLIKSYQSLVSGQRDMITNMANLAAVGFNNLDKINWFGFYILKSGRLMLGPFQGKPACTKIELAKGVCGTAASEKKTIIVKDVDKFNGHIVCDPNSRSEIVIPIIKEKKLVGVMDVDSPILNRFDSTDKKGLEELVRIFIDSSDL